MIYLNRIFPFADIWFFFFSPLSEFIITSPFVEQYHDQSCQELSFVLHYFSLSFLINSSPLIPYIPFNALYLFSCIFMYPWKRQFSCVCGVYFNVYRWYFSIITLAFKFLLKSQFWTWAQVYVDIYISIIFNGS